jgi:hypothetical protein
MNIQAQFDLETAADKIAPQIRKIETYTETQAPAHCAGRGQRYSAGLLAASAAVLALAAFPSTIFTDQIEPS